MGSAAHGKGKGGKDRMPGCGPKKKTPRKWYLIHLQYWYTIISGLRAYEMPSTTKSLSGTLAFEIIA